MRHRLKQLAFDRRERQMTLQEVFSDIYGSNRWGGTKGEFYSGNGSDDESSAPYVANVLRFIADHDVHSVVDIGCGDFRVGSKLVSSNLHYTGIDIVSPLIEQNKSRYESKNVAFMCANAVEDPLPSADLCLIRQVLQHLSNAQISAILAKTGVYKYVLVTEHHPAVATTGPNRDKLPGSGIRRLYGSGVYLEQPPYSLNTSVLFETPVIGFKGDTLRTYLITRSH
jgi:SAM-dependent methyltransferase